MKNSTSRPINSSYYLYAGSIINAAILAGMTTLSIAGCSSGGSSAPPNAGGFVPNQPGAPAPAPAAPQKPAPQVEVPFNKEKVTIKNDLDFKPAQSVSVAVVDSGVDLSSAEFAGKNGVGGNIIAGGVNVSQSIYENYFKSSPDGAGYKTNRPVDDFAYRKGDLTHGNMVADIIAGKNLGYSGNASLIIEKITDSGDPKTILIANALGDAADRGASFANVSYGYDPVADYDIAATAIYFQRAGFTDLALQKVIDKNMGVIVAAGNSSGNLSNVLNTTGYGWTIENPMNKQTLFVGALSDTDANALASYSNYPGENKLIQARFIVAPGTSIAANPESSTGLSVFSGTSAAAPVVTAAAATLKAFWPFLQGSDIEQRLLDTADKNFSSDWSKNTCGSTGTVNCGTYYFGQGRLNLKAALEPLGNMILMPGVKIDLSNPYDSSVGLRNTSLSVPASLGSIQKQVQAASVGAQGFDAIGRNYTVNLAPTIGVSVDPSQALGNKMGGLMGSFMSKGSASFTSFDR